MPDSWAFAGSGRCTKAGPCLGSHPVCDWAGTMSPSCTPGTSWAGRLCLSTMSVTPYHLLHPKIRKPGPTCPFLLCPLGIFYHPSYLWKKIFTWEQSGWSPQTYYCRMHTWDQSEAIELASIQKSESEWEMSWGGSLKSIVSDSDMLPKCSWKVSTSKCRGSEDDSKNSPLVFALPGMMTKTFESPSF